MTSLLLALLLQAAPASAAPERFSILEPVKAERCTRKPPPPAPGQPAQDDPIVVCADPLPSQAVPYRSQIPPDHAVPSNPEMKASVALDGPQRNECGVYGENCPVAGGGYILPKLVSGATQLVKGAFAHKEKEKAPKSARIPIPLDDPVPGHATP